MADYFTQFSCLLDVGDAAAVAEAAPLAERALEGLRRVLSATHASTFIALRVRGRALAACGEVAAAVADLRASLAGLRRRWVVAAVSDGAEQAKKSQRALAAALRALGDEAGAVDVEALSAQSGEAGAADLEALGAQGDEAGAADDEATDGDDGDAML